MKTIFTCITIIILMPFVACKKDTSNTSIVNPSPNAPINTDGFYGYINLSEFIWLQYPNISILSGNATAEFNDVRYNNTTPDIAPKDAGSVFLNGIQLKKNYSFFATDYSDSTNTIFNSPFTIHTIGNTTIPSFTLSINKPYPSFGNFTTLADTLVKSQGFNFTLTNIVNADSLFAFINPLPYYKHIAVNNQSNITINFTPAELAVLDLSNNKHINFNFYKYDTVFQNSKPYSVTLLKGYSKDVFIKN